MQNKKNTLKITSDKLGVPVFFTDKESKMAANGPQLARQYVMDKKRYNSKIYAKILLNTKAYVFLSELG